MKELKNQSGRDKLKDAEINAIIHSRRVTVSHVC